jgi:hypothetical protein
MRVVADAQGEGNQRPAAWLVDRSAFAAGDPEAVKHSTPSGFAEALLRDEAITDSLVSRTIKDFGLPDAVEINATRAFVMYYRNAARTFIFHQGQQVTLTDIPRSVRILTFKEQPAATPWPMTLTGETANWLSVVKAPAAPPDKLDGTDFAEDEPYLRAKLAPSADASAQNRASSMLAKLLPYAPIPGVDWQTVVFRSSARDAFAVPDGTLFIGDGLIRSANDHELAAVLAHLMGHVCYGHYRAHRSGWSSMSPAKKVGVVTLFAIAVPVVVGVAGVCVLSGGVCPAALDSYDRQHSSAPPANPTLVIDQRREEIEANKPRSPTWQPTE